MSTEELAHRYQNICQQIEQACKKADRNPKSVQLIAVSKFQPSSLIEELYNLGQYAFGENYAQEFSEKAISLQDKLPQMKWHFIGSLQRNKVKLIADKVHLLHTVDRISLLEALASYGRTHSLPPQNCLIEVNVGEEKQKSGCAEPDLPKLLEAFAKTEGQIRCKGFMCIPPVHRDPEHSRSFFRKIRKLQQTFQGQRYDGVDLQELSMGMSSDFLIAIEEGATIVRIGTALFGVRPSK